MKKTILAILIAVSLPVSSLALTPGYGGDITCQVWREGDPKPDVNGQPRYCTVYQNQEEFKRFYELEVLVNKLQRQIDEVQQKSQNTVVAQSSPENYRLDNLEKRISGLEVSVKFIQTKVMEVFQITIGFLQKLTKK